VSVQGAVSIQTKHIVSISFSEYLPTDIKIIDFYIESLYMTLSYINYTGDALGLIQKMSAVDLSSVSIGAIIKNTTTTHMSKNIRYIVHTYKNQ
jgi:hypothetical protein